MEKPKWVEQKQDAKVRYDISKGGHYIMPLTVLCMASRN